MSDKGMWSKSSGYANTNSRYGELTAAQKDTIERLSGELTYLQVGPFDLPAGYVMVTIGGITYGISPNGDASS